MILTSCSSYFTGLISLILINTYTQALAQVRLTNEKKLIKSLIERYPIKWGRPFANDSSSTLMISFGITLVQIIELDAGNQMLVTNVWSKYAWKDEDLTWNPDQYGGLKSVRIPPPNVFTPDIVLFNNADTRLEDKRDTLVVVYHDGEIVWIPPSIFRSTCSIDIKYFPFDVQNCSMKFGSWTYETELLDLKFVDDRESVDLAEYAPSNEWTIIEAPAFKHIKMYNSKNYTDLTFNLVLRRNGGFLTYILILPCMLLAMLTMVVFWLPPETPAKMILGMSIFSAFFLLLLLLADLVPQATEEVPMIGIYYCLNMIMIALSAFLCTIVIHVYWRADHFCKLPPLLKTIFIDGLGRLYLMVPKQPEPSKNTLLLNSLMKNRQGVPNGDKFEKFELLKERFKAYRENMLKNALDNLIRTQPNTDVCKIKLTTNYDPTCQCSYCSYCAQHQLIIAELTNLTNLEKDIKEIRDYLRDTRKKVEAREYKVKVASEWKLMALVLDRTFFFIFLCVTIIVLFLMFPRNVVARKTAKQQMLETHDESNATSISAMLNLF